MSDSTRLVVHAGGHSTGWRRAQRQLVAWRGELDRLGVRLPASDAPDAWQAAAGTVVRGTPAQRLTDAVHRAIDDGSAAFVLSAERLEDDLRDPRSVTALVQVAMALGTPLVVVVVVRDQIGALNDLYCERATELVMVRDFASFATEPAPGARFDLEHAFAPLAEAPEVELVAVPYSSLPPERPAAAVVMAAGLAAEQLAVLPAANDERTPSGPLLVAASRLLSKRAFRHGLSGSLPRTRLLEGAAHLQELARQGHWDQGGYWGWTPSQRRAAIGRYTRGNDAFASARWGRPWGDDWSDGMFTDTDLASADPPLVVEVLDAVDLVFRELKASRAAAASD